jgi:hypothetical protein
MIADDASCTSAKANTGKEKQHNVPESLSEQNKCK